MPEFNDDGVCIITNYEVSKINTAVYNSGSNFVSNPTSFTSDIAYK